MPKKAAASENELAAALKLDEQHNHTYEHRLLINAEKSRQSKRSYKGFGAC